VERRGGGCDRSAPRSQSHHPGAPWSPFRGHLGLPFMEEGGAGGRGRLDLAVPELSTCRGRRGSPEPPAYGPRRQDREHATASLVCSHGCAKTEVADRIHITGSITLPCHATKLLPFFDHDRAFHLVLYLLDEMLGRRCGAEQPPCTATPRPLHRQPPRTRRPDEPFCYLCSATPSSPLSSASSPTSPLRSLHRCLHIVQWPPR
jgi:hypothetical protein